MKTVMLVLMLGILTSTVKAEIVKCIENGKTTFSDKPCPRGAKTFELGIDNVPQPVVETEKKPTLIECASTVSRESRINQINFDISEKESRIRANVEAMNREINRLKTQSASVNDSKLNAQWQQSLAMEMRAVSTKYQVENNALQHQIDALRSEKTALAKAP